MNVVMTGSGQYIEIQGTAETKPFDNSRLQQLLTLAESGIRDIVTLQKEALGENS
jgi:ribonuclease PH